MLPSGRSAEIARIVTFDGDLDEAHAPLSVTLVLDREVDVSRGNLLVSSEHQVKLSKSIEASVVWMDDQELRPGRRYLLKHGSQTVPAAISAIEHRTDVATLKREPAEALRMNDVGVIALQLLRPIAVDLYSENRSTGAFILIDGDSNHTVAAGMIIHGTDRGTDATQTTESGVGPVSSQERAARWGHQGGLLTLRGSRDIIDQVERALFLEGYVVARIDDSTDETSREAIARWAVSSGILALVVTEAETQDCVASIGDRRLVLAGTSILPLYEMLTERGILGPLSERLSHDEYCRYRS